MISAPGGLQPCSYCIPRVVITDLQFCKTAYIDTFIYLFVYLLITLLSGYDISIINNEICCGCILFLVDLLSIVQVWRPFCKLPYFNSSMISTVFFAAKQTPSGENTT